MQKNLALIISQLIFFSSRNFPNVNSDGEEVTVKKEQEKKSINFNKMDYDFINYFY